MGESLRTGSRSIKEIVQFDDEELTEEETGGNKVGRPLRTIDKIEKLYQTALKQATKLENTTKLKRRAYLRAKYALARTRIQMSQLVRSIDFNPMEKKRLMDKIRQTESGSNRSSARPGSSSAAPVPPRARPPAQRARSCARAARN